jgi:processive 1,2-diacylglycerol beta-glucosyltransferase
MAVTPGPPCATIRASVRPYAAPPGNRRVVPVALLIGSSLRDGRALVLTCHGTHQPSPAGGSVSVEPLAEPRGRALLVSGALGMGHAVTAQACADALAARGWSVQTVDAMRLLGRRAGGAGQRVFRSMIAVPGLYDAFHFAALRPGTRLALLADAGARRQLIPRLTHYLDNHPADLAISVFATGASAISALADRYPAMTHVVFCWDATPHRLWVHPHVDMYLVTSQVAERAVRRFQPRARVRIVPPPVRAAFYATPPRAGARDTLGIPGRARCVLLMSGGWGLGPVAAVAAALGDAGAYVLAVAGSNARLEAALRAVAERQPRVRAFGFTDRVPELMAAADLVITSPGGTCAEARAVGRPLLLLDVLPGHGRDNLQHELELGNAYVTSPSHEDVVASALAALAAGGETKPAYGAGDWEAAFASVLAELL